MLKFGMLCLGQGGGNIGEYAYTKNFEVVVANTAKVDLKQLKYIPENDRIHLGGHGAGRDRQVGVDAFIENAEEIYEKCLNKFEDCDAVFAVGTGGGGTGSGALPAALEMLSSTFKYVGCIIGLPAKNEAPRAQMNTVECFSELSQLNELGSVFIVDNEETKKMNPNTSRRDIYRLTNRRLIDCLNELNQLTDKMSYVDNFDANDLLSIIQERGYTHITKTSYYPTNSENKYNISEKIRKSWEKSYQPKFDLSTVVKGALIGIIPEEISIEVESDLIFKDNGLPYDFKDIYFRPNPNELEKKAGKSKNTFYTLLSGLKFPQSRLDQIKNDINKVEDKLVNNYKNSVNQKIKSQSYNSKFSQSGSPMSHKLNNLRSNNNNDDGKKKKMNVMDQLSKYREK
jgi:cell division GTPase FtsZ